MTTRLLTSSLLLASLACTPTPTETDPKPAPDNKQEPTKPPAPEPAAVPDRAEVERRIQAWLDTQPDKLRFEVTEGKFVFEPHSRSFELNAGGYEINIDFRSLPGNDTSAADLQATFSYVVIDEVPLPIDAPGWDLRLRTPSSSASEGFTIKSHENGKLVAELEWRFYTVLGYKQDEKECPKIADAPTPEPCYASVEKDLPFTMTFDVELDPTCSCDADLSKWPLCACESYCKGTDGSECNTNSG